MDGGVVPIAVEVAVESRIVCRRGEGAFASALGFGQEPLSLIIEIDGADVQGGWMCSPTK